MKIPVRLTDLSRSDFAEIARIVNMAEGEGVVIDRRADRIVVSIDQGWLKKFIVDTIYGGGTSE